MKTTFTNNTFIFILMNLVILIFLTFFSWIHTIEKVPIGVSFIMFGSTLILTFLTLPLSKEFMTKISIDTEKIVWIFNKRVVKEINWDDIYSLKFGVLPTGLTLKINYENGDSQNIYFYINRNKLNRIKMICPKKELQDQLLKIKL